MMYTPPNAASLRARREWERCTLWRRLCRRCLAVNRTFSSSIRDNAEWWIIGVFYGVLLIGMVSGAAIKHTRSGGNKS